MERRREKNEMRKERKEKEGRQDMERLGTEKYGEKEWRKYM